MDTVRVAVLGPGGVGGLLAALLAREGAEVTCLATPESAAALAARGITVESERFGVFSQPVGAAAQLASPVDVLCVAVKATTLDDAIGRVPPEVLGDALVVPFLNGVEHVGALRRHFPRAEVVAATIRIESARLAPGQIVQKSPFASVEIAPAPAVRARAAAFADWLTRAGLDVAVRDDERAILWEKLSFIAPLALLTTAYASPAGAVRTEHRSELEAVIEEVATIARAEGVSVEGAKILSMFDSVPATMQSSMQRDAAAGLSLEVDAIGGAVVRAAATHAIATPALRRLVAVLDRPPGALR